MLDGEEGPAVQKAVEIVSALARIYGAEKLVPITSANVSGVSYKNLLDPGLEFLNEWADLGARVRVPTTLNPAGMDLLDWKAHGIPSDFATKQERVISAFERMGIPKTCTCTPYHIGNKPGFGEHIAWGESSAVCYANSVLGARTNREGGPSALASAICGRTGLYGYHLDEKRLADVAVRVDCALKDASDYGALGNLIGRKLGNEVPCFSGISPGDAELKALGASLAAWGGVALFHVEGVTPEAMQGNMLRENHGEIVVDSLDEAFDIMNSGGDLIDIVSIGCPHASREDLGAIAGMVAGKSLKATLWVTTSRFVKDSSPDSVRIIEKAGGTVVADACLVVAPIREMGFTRLATNSGKMAFYSPGHCGASVRYGTLEQCIEAAVQGRWPE